MSLRNKKFRKNAPGKYFVIDICIGCSLCFETAPNNYRMNYEEGYGYVRKQPESIEEEAMCLKAMQSCPASAIEHNELE